MRRRRRRRREWCKFFGTWIVAIRTVAESGTVRVAAWVCSRATADAAGCGYGDRDG